MYKKGWGILVCNVEAKNYEVLCSTTFTYSHPCGMLGMYVYMYVVSEIK
jgi:hypothetical protein